MIYETQADRDREADILAQYGAARSLDITPAERHASCDAYGYVRGTLMEVIEVKSRTTPRTKYPTYHIDKHKVDKLRSKAEIHCASPVLIVSWQDSIGYINFNRYTTPDGWLRLTTGVTRRRDRDERADVVYHIPIQGFVLLEDK